MSQHDLNIANADGATVRADLNGALAALGSTMKGPSAPPSPQAGLVWLDDSASPWMLRIYDGADWIPLGTVNPVTNEYAPVIADGAIGTAKLAVSAVTFAKMQSIANARLLGRTTAGSGQVEEISIGTGLTLASGVLAAEGGGVPTGSIVPTAATAEPSGWLFCYGQAVGRTTYATLFTAIGTNYGAGDGSTTFNIPDLRGRIVAGRDDMGGSAASRLTSGGSGINGTTLGAAGGSQAHTLAASEMPSHTHTLNTSFDNPGASNAPASAAYRNSNSDGNTVTVTTGSAGSGGAHQNTQPTIIANYIIKT